MTTTYEIDLSAGDANALATMSQWSQIDPSRPVRVSVVPLANQLRAGAYAAEWMLLSALGVPYPDLTKRIASGIGGSLREGRRNQDVAPWLLDLYAAQIRSCRAFARDGALDVPRAWMPVVDPSATVDGATIVRAAAVSPVVVTAGVVGAVAAVSLAIAWWARGRDQAQAAASGATVRHAAASAAAAKVALGYVQAGQSPPPEVIAAFGELARGESAREWAVPLAVALPLTAAVGVGVYQVTRPRAAAAG